MDLLGAPLRSFLTIARLGSVSAAAQSLGLTQPAVTKQVRALEAELGAVLLERAGRGVRLSAAGALLADFGRRGAALFEDFRTALAELERGHSGRLSIGAGVTTSVQHLPPWLREFRRRYPGVDVSIRTGTSRDVEDWVASADVDLGFVTSEPRRSGLVARRLFEEEIVLVVAPGSARARAVALESLPLILFPKSSGFRQYLEQRFVARRQAFNVKMETDNVEAIKSFVTVGLGASFLPLATVAEDLRRGSLLRVEPRGLGSLRRRTAVLWRQERKPTFAMQSFLAIVVGSALPGARAQLPSSSPAPTSSRQWT
jgi:DNA-binding transcriptional LysR family regulator